MPARGPAAHHVVRQLEVELEGEGGAAVLERLMPERLALGEQHGALRQVEAFAMPLIDVIRPLEKLAARFRRPQRIVADLDEALGMKVDLGAERPRDDLRAEA